MGDNFNLAGDRSSLPAHLHRPKDRHLSFRGDTFRTKHASHMSLSLPSFSIFKSGGGHGASGVAFSPLFVKKSDRFLEKFMGKRSLSSRILIRDVHESAEGCRTLLRAGQYKQCHVLADRLLSQIDPASCTTDAAKFNLNVLKLYKIVFFFRISTPDAALETFLTIPEFERAKLHETISPTVPFSLYVLYAEMFHRRTVQPDRRQSGDRLHFLLNAVRKERMKISKALSNGEKKPLTQDYLLPFVPSQEALQIWAAREVRIILALINFHLSQRETTTCLALLMECVRLHPGNLYILFQAGIFYLHLGAHSSADHLFSAMEKLYCIQKSGYSKTAQDELAIWIPSGMTASCLRIVCVS